MSNYDILTSQYLVQKSTMRQTKITKQFILGLLISTLFALAGCGQKGELYLPGQKSTATFQQYTHKLS